MISYLFNYNFLILERENTFFSPSSELIGINNKKLSRNIKNAEKHILTYASLLFKSYISFIKCNKNTYRIVTDNFYTVRRCFLNWNIYYFFFYFILHTSLIDGSTEIISKRSKITI